MDNQSALETQELSLQAITALTKVLSIIDNQCSNEEYNAIKKGVGLSIGTIQVELLDVLSAICPDINNLD